MAIPDRKKLARLFADMQRIEEHRTLTAERQIRKLYSEMLKDLQGFIGVEYAKFADDDRLTYSTLAQKGEYARFLREVQAKVSKITPNVDKAITDVVKDIYKVAYEGMVKAVSKSVNDTELTKLLGGIHLTQPQVIKAAVNNPIAKLTLSDTLKKNRKQIVYNIKQTVTVGIMNGDRMSTMARKIKNDVDQNYRKAMLIARTEVHRVRETGHNDASQSIDDTLASADSEYRMVKTWKSMRDSAVRKTNKADHRKMDGQTVLQHEKFDLGNAKAECPGQSGKAFHDCNCRCYVSHDLMSDEEFFQATGRHFPQAEKLAKKIEKIEKVEKVEKVEATQDTFESKIAKIKSQIAETGATEEQVKEAGKLVEKEFFENSDFVKRKKAYEKAVEECNTSPANADKVYKAYKAEKNKSRREELFAEYKKLRDSEEWKRLKKARSEAFEAYTDKIANAASLKDTLSKIREMGCPDADKILYKSRNPMRKVVANAADHYPTSWINRMEQRGKIEVKKTKRGYWDRRNNLMAISGDNEEECFETAIHELGHNFEVIVKTGSGSANILIAEKRFYDRRTDGEPLVGMEGYSNREKTRRDNFIDDYIGKDNGGHSYELVSMGFQLAYTDPMYLASDKDMAEWIYGILALYD